MVGGRVPYTPVILVEVEMRGVAGLQATRLLCLVGCGTHGSFSSSPQGHSEPKIAPDAKQLIGGRLLMPQAREGIVSTTDMISHPMAASATLGWILVIDRCGQCGTVPDSP